jgi:adenylate kinase family enzyme
MERGELQPAFLAIHVWSHLLIEQMNEEKHVIIDGTPRKLEEAKILDEAMQFYNRGKIKIIYMNVSDEWATARLSGRGRTDDKSAEEIKKRLAWFKKDVMPAVEYFKNNPHVDFLDINGEQTIEEVKQEIFSKLGL